MVWVPHSVAFYGVAYCGRGRQVAIVCPYICIGSVSYVEHYKYMEDLKSLENSGCLEEVLRRVQTPLKVSVWEECLRSYPDKEFSEYIIWG